MPSAETKYFGTMAYREESVFEFPWGLPAFEHEKRFVLIESPENAPLVFLQSLTDPALCFLAFPILVVDRDYQLGISPEDLAALELDTDRQPELGGDALVLALLSLHDGISPTANLMAPIVINLGTRRALQAIRCDSLYSYQQGIAPRSAQERATPVSKKATSGCGCACSQPGTRPGCSREGAC
jgi:flagellar assembly factor FliW